MRDPDPTALEGPERVEVAQGATRGIRLHLNAEDTFLNEHRGTLTVDCDHPDVADRDITVGQLHNGSARITIVLDDTAALGECRLVASVRDWERAAGGLGPDLEWPMTMAVVAPREPSARRQRGDQSAEQEGELVGLIWKHQDDFDHWTPAIPGHVEEIEAMLLADWDDDYRELKKLGDAKVPTIFLNLDYSPLKRYEAARAKDLTEQGRDDARDRYAVGAGLGLLLLDRDLRATSNNGGVPPEVELTAKQAAAQSALVMMPHYDRLAQETGIEH